MGFHRKKQHAPALAATPAARPAVPAVPDARAQRREQDRAVRRSDRELEAERAKLAADERRIQAEIKSLVRRGRMPEARMLSKNLIQNRNAQAKLFAAKTQLSGISNQTAVMASQAKVVDALAGANKIMGAANSAANPNKMMSVAQNYEMESSKMGMAQEMTDDVLDDIMGGSEVDADADAALKSVLDEIGLDIAGSMQAAPVARPAPIPQQQAQATQNSEADELLRRIAMLEGKQ